MPIQRLNQMIAQGGNCVNLGRTIQARHRDLYNHIMSHTQFLDHKNPKFNERVYCLINGITAQVMTVDGRPAIFDNLFVGYSLREKVTQLKKAGDVTRTKKAQRAANVEQAEKDQRDEYMRWAEMVCSTDIQVGERLCKHVRYWPTNSGKPLYESDLIEGEDYVICPITKLRKAMIRSNYVENILAMTMEEYSAVVGPDFVYTAPNHKNTIAQSLKVVDEETGLTKTEIAVIKTQEKLNSVDETTGLTGHEMRIAKTVNTHKNKIDENGLNGYQRLVKYRHETVLENGLTVDANARIKRLETIEANGGSTRKASALSVKALTPIIRLLDDMDIKYYFDQNEYCIRSMSKGVNYYFDLTIPSIGLAIEYQSNAYHAWPFMDSYEWSEWRQPLGETKGPQSSLDYDYEKARELYEERGIRTFHVWQKTQDNDVEILLCFIKTGGTMY